MKAGLKALARHGPAFLLAAAAAWGQATAIEQPPANDVAAMLKQAREEIRNFEKTGGKNTDTNHPVGKWAETLWAFREKSAGTADAAKATSEAVHLLIHAGRFTDAYARADQVAPQDSAWEGLAQVLFEAASLQKDFTYFFRKLDTVLPAATDRKVRAALQLGLGRAWREKKEPEKARAAFQDAIESGRDSTSGKQAEAELYEVLHLSPGQPAPQFSVPAINGAPLSLADYRGKPLVLVFWGTY